MDKEAEEMNTGNKVVDDFTLARCRKDPSLAGRVHSGGVVCLECGVVVRRLTRSPNAHARRIHRMDAAAYLAKWPGAPLTTAEAVQDERDTRKLYIELNREQLQAWKRKYSSRPEVKARENAGRRKKWPKWYAENREAESTRRKERHRRYREQENAQTRQRYEKNIDVERAKNREKARKVRELARMALRQSASKDGRPATKAAIFKQAAELHAKGLSWSLCAKRLVPSESSVDLVGAGERLRKGVQAHNRRSKL
jgi:hypothetical protein